MIPLYIKTVRQPRRDALPISLATTFASIPAAGQPVLFTFNVSLD
jgi:hypothetical protein